MALEAVTFLFVVNRLIRRPTMLEVALRILGRYRNELARLLREGKEIVGEVRRALVRVVQRAQSPVVLGESQDTAELVNAVRDVPLLGTCGDGQQRNAKSEPLIIAMRRYHMVEPAAPIVPRHENDCRVPI